MKASSIARAAFGFAAFAASLTPAGADSTGTLTFTSPRTDMVMISVGGGKPVPVTFDTGSVGLQIYDFGVGKDATPATDKPGVRRYGGQRVFRVKYMMANIAIEGISTTAPVEIAVVTGKSCSDGHCPDVTGAAMEAAAKKSGRIGIMGVGFGNGGNVTPNPIRSLPARYRDGYVVTNEGVSLGLASATGFKTVRQPSAGDGTYGKLFNACLTMTGTSLKNGCAQTLFDTGNGSVTVAPSQLAVVPATKHAARAVIPGVVDWSFTGGPNAIHFDSHTPAVFGLPLLTAYDVEIDLANGTYGFRKRATPVPLSAMRSLTTH